MAALRQPIAYYKGRKRYLGTTVKERQQITRLKKLILTLVLARQSATNTKPLGIAILAEQKAYHRLAYHKNGLEPPPKRLFRTIDSFSDSEIPEMFRFYICYLCAWCWSQLLWR